MRKYSLPVSQNFDEIFETFTKSAFNADKMYPPYNTYEQDDKEFIELAVTGLSKENINAYFEDGYLVIDGKYPETDRKYFHKGLSRKDFKRKFQLAKDYEVDTINVKDGLCTIELVENKPEMKYLEIH